MIIRTFKEIQQTDLALVGGKGLNLGLLVKAGFRVPDGFCVTTQAYRETLGDGSRPPAELPEDMTREILDAYSNLGCGRVAVRSSATAEDLPDASFAGQQDTFLNVRGDENLLTAIANCWASLWSDRAVAYRHQQGIDDDRVLMAVVVQKMLDSDASGVMFSISPTHEDHLMIEASWGLGEAIVSGKVTPDSFTVDRNSLQIINRTISAKKLMIAEGGEVEVPPEKQSVPSLTDEQITKLARLGLEIENFYSSPQDIEWALTGEELYILQSRPITVRGTGDEVSRLREEEIEKLRNMAEETGTVWCGFNLSETLPAPLPMTWAIISKFMSGRGGFGMTYRDLGFLPGKEVDEKGVVDLICGRSYFNLSREARLYFDEFPFEHNFQKLKENPASASYPQPTVNIKRTTAKFWLKFPYYVYKMIAAEGKIKRLRKSYDDTLKNEIIPEYRKYIDDQKRIELGKLPDAEIISKLNEWLDKVLRDHAKDGLKATIIAGRSYTNLDMALRKCLGEDARNMLEDLTVGLEGDMTVKTNRKLWEVAHGQLEMQDFLRDYGHRAAGEYELAQPRWREDTEFVQSMVDMFREHEEMNPEAQFRAQKERREKAESTLRERLSEGKARAYSKSILTEMQYVQRYMPYRETAKFYLMMGYELIRNALLELGRRHLDSVDGIFYLTPEELPELIAGGDFSQKIADRKSRRDKLLSIELPDVIFSDSLHQIGDPPLPESSQELEGVAISSGVATGTARVLLKPPNRAADTGTGYILVCPSTDPGWAPLFPGARGLVMERGGVLSHGAIVAREYGIPAVANIAGATKIIKDCQQIKVNGNKGKVFI